MTPSPFEPLGPRFLSAHLDGLAAPSHAAQNLTGYHRPRVIVQLLFFVKIFCWNPARFPPESDSRTVSIPLTLRQINQISDSLASSLSTPPRNLHSLPTPPS